MAKHPHHGRMKHFNRYFAMIARQPQLNVHHDCHQMDPQATVSSAGTVKDQIKGYPGTCAQQWSGYRRRCVRPKQWIKDHMCALQIQTGCIGWSVWCLTNCSARFGLSGVSETGLEL